MSATLVLVRHGQTDWNVNGRYMGWIDEALNEEGPRQAAVLADRLADWPVSAVYSSPLKRALATAETIAGKHSLEVQTLDDLGEMRIGEWEGMYAWDIAARYSELWKAWRASPGDFRMPGGESLNEVRERAIRAFSRMTGGHEGRMVLAVTHDVVVRLLVAHCLGVSQDIYRRLEVGNASVTVIESDGGRLRLRVLNDTAHLEGFA
ncbi:MAG: histidine phosphatase family protein [Dehalococcoidia bacterium]|nr:histidine phosphatase family protein [Dehalococcoidia bacterium]